LLSEPAIVSRLARALLGESGPVPWRELAEDYDRIRDRIERGIPGFDRFNERIERDIFHLPNAARTDRQFRIGTGKANFHVGAQPAGYWGAVLKHLPGADVVFDRFHIIKLANEKIDDLRRALQREAGILERRYIKGTRYLLLMGKENVPPHRRAALE
jgi:hypothetical protein